MAILTEQNRNWEFLIQPANGDRSFDKATFDSATDWAGAAILPGQVYAVVGGVTVAWDGDAVDGSEDAAGILLEGVEAGADVERGVIVRDATVKRYKLTYDGTDAELDAALLALGIVVRDN